MSLVSYVENRSLGKTRSKQRNFDIIDFLLSRLQCELKDEIPVHGFDDRSQTSYEVPPFASKFCLIPGQEHILAVANEEGDVGLLNTDFSGESAAIKSFRAHSNAIFDIAWVPGQKQIVSVSGDQTAKLWDVPHSQIISTFKGHTSSIKSIDFYPDDQFVFATGSRDGSIMIWDTRCYKKDEVYSAENVIRNAHCPPPNAGLTPQPKKKCKVGAQDSLQSVTVVLFQNENTLVSSGAADATIKIWDIRKHYSNCKGEPLPKYKIPYAGKSKKLHGFSSLTFDSTFRRLFANCTDNVIYQFDCASYSPTPLSVYTGYINSTFYVKSVLNPDDNYLFGGSSDDNAYIWKVSEAGDPVFKFEGHGQEVTSVAWCRSDVTKLVSCCDDMRVRLWRPNFNAPDNEKDIQGLIRGKVQKIRNLCETTTKHRQLSLKSPSTTMNRKSILPGFSSPNASIPYLKMSTPSAVTQQHLTTPSRKCFLQNWLSGSCQINITKEENVTKEERYPSESRTMQGYVTPYRTKRKLNRDECENQENSFSLNRPTPKLPSENSESTEARVFSPSKQLNEENRRAMSMKCLDFSSPTGKLQPQSDNLPSKIKTEKWDESVKLESTPAKCRSVQLFPSPTQNLPNLVLDQSKMTSSFSATRKSDLRQTDWLTALRKQKKFSGKSVTPRNKIIRTHDTLTPEKEVASSPKAFVSDSCKKMKAITNYFKISNGLV